MNIGTGKHMDTNDQPRSEPCDDLLEWLTSPIPSVSENQRIAEHIANCPACRVFAEQTAPAINLFRLVVNDRDHKIEGVSTGRMHPEIAPVAPASETQVLPAGSQRTAFSTPITAQFLACVSLAILTVWLASPFKTSDSSRESTSRFWKAVAFVPKDAMARLNEIGAPESCQNAMAPMVRLFVTPIRCGEHCVCDTVHVLSPHARGCQVCHGDIDEKSISPPSRKESGKESCTQCHDVLSTYELSPHARAGYSTTPDDHHGDSSSPHPTHGACCSDCHEGEPRQGHSPLLLACRVCHETMSP